MDLLVISDENKSHYVYIKDFNRFMCNKTKNKNKKHWENCNSKTQGNWLVLNGKQRVKLKGGTISFEKHFKQLPVPFKIYADFECMLKVCIMYSECILKCILAHLQKNIKIIFLAVFLSKLFVLIKNLARKLFFTGGKKCCL